MSRPGPGFEVRRIVVAIDSSSNAASALEEAAGLAARLHAELEGVYVQDINLVRLGRVARGSGDSIPHRQGPGLHRRRAGSRYPGAGVRRPAGHGRGRCPSPSGLRVPHRSRPGGRGGHQRGRQRRPPDSRYREPLPGGPGPARPHGPGRGRARTAIRTDIEARGKARRRPVGML